MKVAACQLPHVGKDVHRALSLIEAYTADAERRGAALVCFPECFLQGCVVTAEHVAETAIFDPGNEHTVFDACGVKVAINICNDLNHAESVETVARPGAKLLVCPCNDLLPPGAAEQWKARHNEIRRRRAQEAGMWLVSSDVTGVVDGRISYGPTAIIDPLGRIVEQVPLMTTGMVVAEIE